MAYKKSSFEDCIDVINQELLKRKSKWRLNAIAWMDFDDVCQKIRLHIFNKWHQWDQDRPLVPWINRIITNQMTNLVRNNYSSFSRPCSQCQYNQGGDLCELYGTQCSDCPIFAKWEKSKKNAHDIKIPLSINDPCFSFNNNFNDNDFKSIDIKDNYSYVNYDEKISKIHTCMKEKLTTVEWKIYNFLFIENKTDVETAKLMGYKTNEKNRSPGYKQIKKVKNKIYQIAKEIAKDIL
jgi:hypothetical protein